MKRRCRMRLFFKSECEISLYQITTKDLLRVPHMEAVGFVLELYLYRPQQQLREGNVPTGIFQSVQGRGQVSLVPGPFQGVGISGTRSLLGVGISGIRSLLGVGILGGRYSGEGQVCRGRQVYTGVPPPQYCHLVVATETLKYCLVIITVSKFAQSSFVDNFANNENVI